MRSITSRLMKFLLSMLRSQYFYDYIESQNLRSKRSEIVIEKQCSSIKGIRTERTVSRSERLQSIRFDRERNLFVSPRTLMITTIVIISIFIVFALILSNVYFQTLTNFLESFRDHLHLTHLHHYRLRYDHRNNDDRFFTTTMTMFKNNNVKEIKNQSILIDRTSVPIELSGPSSFWIIDDAMNNKIFKASNSIGSGHGQDQLLQTIQIDPFDLSVAKNKTSRQDDQYRTEHHHNGHRRFKRGVIGLASMIRCVAGCSPLSYKDYGCYCGFQGQGRPVDPIDKCCFMHDRCYSRAKCHQILVYFVPYKWACLYNGRASCGYSNAGSKAQNLCAYQLCDCDRKFAKCLSRYRCPKKKKQCLTADRNPILGLKQLFFES
ncbi:hypothetical protein NH340_JMT04361 [Sarcoptes scabiei]|nr:hypothetical protein NH340_JMT04361 [Sarcoptes scabiei]